MSKINDLRNKKETGTEPETNGDENLFFLPGMEEGADDTEDDGSGEKIVKSKKSGARAKKKVKVQQGRPSKDLLGDLDNRTQYTFRCSGDLLKQMKVYAKHPVAGLHGIESLNDVFIVAMGEFFQSEKKNFEKNKAKLIDLAGEF